MEAGGGREGGREGWLAGGGENSLGLYKVHVTEKGENGAVEFKGKRLWDVPRFYDRITAR